MKNIIGRRVRRIPSGGECEEYNREVSVNNTIGR